MSRSGGTPKVLVLRMSGVPIIDSSGAAALKRFIKNVAAKGTVIIPSELNSEPAQMLHDLDLTGPTAATFEDSIAIARALISGRNDRALAPA